MKDLFTKPEFFDIFGLIVFIFIIALSSYMLYTKKMPKTWLIILLLVIGVLGLIIDGISVFVNYIK